MVMSKNALMVMSPSWCPPATRDAQPPPDAAHPPPPNAGRSPPARLGPASPVERTRRTTGVSRRTPRQPWIAACRPTVAVSATVAVAATVVVSATVMVATTVVAAAVVPTPDSESTLLPRLSRSVAGSLLSHTYCGGPRTRRGGCPADAGVDADGGAAGQPEVEPVACGCSRPESVQARGSYGVAAGIGSR